MTGETRGCTCEFKVEHSYPALVDDEKTAVFLREKLQKAGMKAERCRPSWVSRISLSIRWK